MFGPLAAFCHVVSIAVDDDGVVVVAVLVQGKESQHANGDRSYKFPLKLPPPTRQGTTGTCTSGNEEYRSCKR